MEKQTLDSSSSNIQPEEQEEDWTIKRTVRFDF